MIGPGIDLNNGKISHTPPPKASKTVHGLVKIGPGLDVVDGVASAPVYQHADHENYGTVKLSPDFKTGNSGELLLANKKDVEEIIYQTANVGIAQNNCIIIKSSFAKYRLFLNEDALITFDWSQIVIEKDLAFDLEYHQHHSPSDRRRFGIRNRSCCRTKLSIRIFFQNE